MKSESIHNELTDALREQLSLYALGLLEGEESALLSRHLESGCGVCNQEFAAYVEALGVWSSALQLETPPPELKERLMSRIRSEIAASKVDELPPGFLVVRSGSAKWRPSPWQGISFVKLFQDKQTGAATSTRTCRTGSKISSSPPRRCRAELGRRRKLPNRLD